MLVSAAELNQDGLLEYNHFAPVAFDLIKQIVRESKIKGKMSKKLITRAHYHMVAADAPADQDSAEDTGAQRERNRRERRKAAAKRREELMLAASHS